MNLIKLTSTDFLAGRILLSGKALLDLLWFLIRNPRPKSLRLAVTHPAADPQIYKGVGEATDKPLSLDTKGKQVEFTRRYSRVRGVEWGICCYDGCCGPKGIFIHLLSRLPIFNSVFTTSCRAYYIFLIFYEW